MQQWLVGDSTMDIVLSIIITIIIIKNTGTWNDEEKSVTDGTQATPLV